MRPNEPTIDPEKHLGSEEISKLWSAFVESAPDREQGVVRSLCLRQEDGSRKLPHRVELDVEQGAVGDRWFLSSKRKRGEQVAVMNFNVAQIFANGQSLELFGDNIFIDLDLSESNLPVGSQLKLGEALVEVSEEPHEACSKFRKRFGASAFKKCFQGSALRARGIYFVVLEAGSVELGALVEVTYRPTLSES